MKTEYGIVDQDGKLFGLPARTFETREAAQNVLTHIQARRLEMELEARRAQENLDSVLVKLTPQHRDHLKEQVKVWELEKPRSYTVVEREVSPWRVCEKAVA